ncbi:MAG TPA: zinc ribbon domain-containing protein [Candidatus Dormibacteraeota bacterium]|nr:zinc ribbon domain-containing protein [Candidatus Dormibacteraeota bacterium]
MRVRRKKEKLRFADEFRIIPRWVIVLVALLFLIAQGIALAVNLTAPMRGDQVFPQELQDHPVLASLALAGIVTLASIFFAAFIFLTAYVNRDAARRGMNAALWTILILIFLPTWGLIGLVIYFLMREPLPYPCPQCGASVSARFNFCPNCKCNLQPSCPQCKCEVGELDKFCPYCGNDLAASSSSERMQQSPSPAS